jgi:hypothetical protein
MYTVHHVHVVDNIILKANGKGDPYEATTALTDLSVNVFLASFIHMEFEIFLIITIVFERHSSLDRKLYYTICTTGFPFLMADVSVKHLVSFPESGSLLFFVGSVLSRVGAKNTRSLFLRR